MDSRILVYFFFSFVCFCGCTQESNDRSDLALSQQPHDFSPEQLEDLVAKGDRGFAIPPPNDRPLGDPPDYSGEWIKRGGIWECDGYLTRFADEEFCTANLPNDWVPFEFEGRTFYVQPLSDNDS